VAHAGLVDQKVFRTASGPGLIAEMHLAWPAREGRIVVLPGDQFATVSRVMHHGSTTGAPLDAFEVDEIVLGLVDQPHERADL
jgi:hypothetical protein